MVNNDQDNGRIDQQDGTLTSPSRVDPNHDNSTPPSNGTLDVVGVPIICPQHSDRAMQACALGTSCFNYIKLATL
jgi:hypothetical protein